MCVSAGKNFFKQGIMDVAWSPDGFTLLVCSYDGTVAMCRMDESELGGWAVKPADASACNLQPAPHCRARQKPFA